AKKEPVALPASPREDQRIGELIDRRLVCVYLFRLLVLGRKVEVSRSAFPAEAASDRDGLEQCRLAAPIFAHEEKHWAPNADRRKRRNSRHRKRICAPVRDGIPIELDSP